MNYENLLLGRLRRVSHVHRFSGMPLVRSETVAEHTFYVMLLCRFLAAHFQQRGTEVFLGQLLARALVHDLDESITGDVVRSVKYRDPEMKAKWEAMAREVVLSLQRDLGVDFLVDWEHAKDDSLEGQILKLADLASVTAYAVEELQCGNANMREVLRENRMWLERWLEEEHLDHDIVMFAQQTIDLTRRFSE